MPKIPTYNYQVNPPQSTSPFLEDVGSKGKVGRAMQGLGQQLMAEGEKFLEERAVMQANEALGKLADEERNFLVEERKKQGSEAFGGQERGHNFYEEAISRNAEGLSSAAQEMYHTRATQYRNQGLDTLAGHEMKEHYNHKVSVLQGRIAGLGEDIKLGTNPDKILERMGEIKESMRNLYKGIDTTEMEAKLEEDTKTALLWEKARTDPNGVKELIEKYSDKVPETTLEQVKKFAEQVGLEQTVDAKVDELLTTYGEDWEKMHKAVKSSGLSPTAKKQVRARIESERATIKSLRDQRRTDNQRKTLNGVAQLWHDKRYNDITKIMLDQTNDLDPSQREHWITKVEAMQKAIAEGTENPFNKTEPETYAYMWKEIYTNPQGVETDDIMKMIGSGISTDVARSMQSTLAQLKKQPDPKMSMAMGIIKEMVDANAFDDEHPVRNLRMSFDLLGMVQKLHNDYPDADPVKDFIEPYYKKIKRDKMLEAYNEFVSIQDAPFIDKKVTASIEKMKYDDEEQFRVEWLGPIRVKSFKASPQ